MTEEYGVEQARIAAHRFCRNRPKLDPKEIMGLAWQAVGRAADAGLKGAAFHRHTFFGIVDLLRREDGRVTRRGVHFLQFSPRDSEYAIPDHRTPELVSVQETWAAASRASKTTNIKYRVMAYLRLVEDMGYEEIAELFGVPPAMPRTAVSKFLRGMRE